MTISEQTSYDQGRIQNLSMGGSRFISEQKKSRIRNKKTKFFYKIDIFFCFAQGFLTLKCYWEANPKSQGSAKVGPLYPGYDLINEDVLKTKRIDKIEKCKTAIWLYCFHTGLSAIIQGCNARKVNCSCVDSAYILKTVLSGRNL